ncbi:DUF4350 domain-containing protein [Rufibacter latericius]|uniref:DUF4350 domain-containing protein n=1 Tax=Rufibacter latericius TaxID=2487040 RepID=A0A3M9MVM0_9BACT|nr:DUF4350 domain-containing protein [Rufibacter latericius]RNI28818.1 DUF4350 domain-containing protein [Rufibacter latericius]
MKNNRLYALGLGVLFAVFVVVEYYRPKPIDWTQTFSNKDKIPYGTFVLFDLLPDLFPDQPVTSVRLPVVNQVEEQPTQEDSTLVAVNYLFVNSFTQLDQLETQTLLQFVEEGNNVFISSHKFSTLLQDTLGFKADDSKKAKQDSLGLVFTHPSLQKNKPVRYAWEKVNRILTLESSRKVTVLGKNTVGEATYVQIPFGKGSFYLSSVPLAFTNYNVLASGKSHYAAVALSHLPVRPVWWDEYQKQGAVGSASVFRVLLSHEALAWAYYLTLGSLLLFVLFESKRTQRIIPVMEKPRNTTLEFVRVIGSLYFNHRDHHVIAEKKITYFLEYLRLHFYESTTVLDKELQDRIVKKSGVPAVDVTEVFRLIQYVRTTNALEEHNLWQLNKQLESFYRQASR